MSRNKYKTHAKKTEKQGDDSFAAKAAFFSLVGLVLIIVFLKFREMSPEHQLTATVIIIACSLAAFIYIKLKNPLE